MPKCKLCHLKCAGKFCSPDHAYQWLSSPEGQKAKDRAAERRAKAKEREAKAKKIAYYRNQLGWQHEQTKLAFNKMRKLEEFVWFKERGIEPYCISCLKTNMDWCCSHFKSVGSSGALRYEPLNTYLACNARCNKALSGNINGNSSTIGFIKGLAHRFGEEEAQRRLNWLEAHQSAIRKWTCGELEEMRKGFNERIRQLQKELS